MPDTVKATGGLYIPLFPDECRQWVAAMAACQAEEERNPPMAPGGVDEKVHAFAEDAERALAAARNGDEEMGDAAPPDGMDKKVFEFWTRAVWELERSRKDRAGT